MFQRRSHQTGKNRYEEKGHYRGNKFLLKLQRHTRKDARKNKKEVNFKTAKKEKEGNIVSTTQNSI